MTRFLTHHRLLLSFVLLGFLGGCAQMGLAPRKPAKDYRLLPKDARLDPIVIYAEKCEMASLGKAILKKCTADSYSMCNELQTALESQLKVLGVAYRWQTVSRKELGKKFDTEGENEIGAKYRMLLPSPHVSDHVQSNPYHINTYRCAAVGGGSKVLEIGPKSVWVEAWNYGRNASLTGREIAQRIIHRDERTYEAWYLKQAEQPK